MIGRKQFARGGRRLLSCLLVLLLVAGLCAVPVLAIGQNQDEDDGDQRSVDGGDTQQSNPDEDGERTPWDIGNNPANPLAGSDENVMDFAAHPVLLYYASLDLQGKIGVNFYLLVPEDVELSICVNGMEMTSEEAELDDRDMVMILGQGYDFRCYTCWVKPSQLDEKLCITALNAENHSYPIKKYDGADWVDVPSTGFEYSALDYLAGRIKNTTDEKMRTLAKRLWDYGYYAAVYLDYLRGEPDQYVAVSTPWEPYLSDRSMKSLAEDWTETHPLSEISCYRLSMWPGVYSGSTAILESDIQMRYYFWVPAAYCNGNLTCRIYGLTENADMQVPVYLVPSSPGSTSVTVANVGGTLYYPCCVQISRITAQELDNSYEMVLYYQGNPVMMTQHASTLNALFGDLDAQAEALLKMDEESAEYDEALDKYYVTECLFNAMVLYCAAANDYFGD